MSNQCESRPASYVQVYQRLHLTAQLHTAGGLRLSSLTGGKLETPCLSLALSDSRWQPLYLLVPIAVQLSARMGRASVS